MTEGHRQVGVAGLIDGNPTAAAVDEGLYDVITTLWRHNIPTLASCQGGPTTSWRVGHQPHGYIMLPNGRDVPRALEVLGWDVPGMVLLEHFKRKVLPEAVSIRFYDALDMRFHLRSLPS